MTDHRTVSGTAIVTGASSGIGRVTAEQFAADGVDVAICSREQANVEPVAEEISAGDGGDAIAIEADVTDREAVEDLVEETVDTFGGVDVLVNNAGASFMAGFDDISQNGWDTIVDVNLTGTKNCTQVAAEHLKAGESGAVVNVASVAGQQGSPYMSHYGAAKAAIINLTKSLAYEWAGDDVRVNCVAPGFVATPGLASQMGIDADDIDRDSVERRMGTSEEIADVIAFLASPAASFIVGETITAGGVPDIMESPDL